MSMSALWASTVSWVRIGSAWLLISWSRSLLFGYCRTVTFSIFPPVTSSWTWTGPHRVCATEPLTVGADEPDDPELPELPELPEPVVEPLEYTEDGADVAD